MEIVWAVALFVLGLIIIIFGGNMLVDNAGKISYITGIPEALIGATIVSLATTLPELNVVIFSAIDGLSSLAIGNSVGSIIFNLTFILGIVFTFTKVKINLKDLGSNFYIMFFTILLIFIFCICNAMNKWVGAILLSIFLLFFINNIIDASKNGVVVNKQNENKFKKGGKKYKLWWIIISFCLSSFFVSFGAKLLVDNGENIARLLNVSEHIIGVTIIAMGTSLPEVVTAITSIKQQRTAIAIGNTIGANILSSTLLLGISAIMEPNGLTINNNITYVALPLILLSSLIIFLPLLKTRVKHKAQGVFLLVLFLAYYLTVII